MLSCGAGKGNSAGKEADAAVDSVAPHSNSLFSVDSAYSYLKRQVEFGPRVPGSEAHRRAADWLVAELSRHGGDVSQQTATLKAFDGTSLECRNIFARFNPDVKERMLLLAHYDSRPWADQDPDPERRKSPVDGANDGASGVAVLLETARHLKSGFPDRGIDILFVDCEDYGTEGDDESWALGAKYFAKNPIISGYAPHAAILLDMVGGKDAVFPAEYFSRQAAPALDDAFRAAAARAGHSGRFPLRLGGAVTDDHIQLIEAGIPAIDIIDYREAGFCPTWHTAADNLSNIDPATLRAVGESLFEFLK